MSKEKGAVDHWLRQIAPSAELRQWFGHRRDRWEEFRRRYFEELDANPGAVGQLREWIAAGPVTIVFAARDEEHSNAQALTEYMEEPR